MFIRIIFYTLLLFFYYPFDCHSDEIFNTIVNRLTKVQINFDSNNPIKPFPAFIAPDNSFILSQNLKTQIYNEKNIYNNTLELFCVFEKEGTFEIGPFVFNDILGNAVTAKRVTVNVTSEETIELKQEKNVKSTFLPKFYTLNSNKPLHPFLPVFLIFELPNNTNELKIIWPNWKGVITDKIGENRTNSGKREIIFSAFFIKPGSYILAPLRISIKNKIIQSFSTSSLKFDVLDIENKPIDNFHIGNLFIKLNAYSGTEGNIINSDLQLSGHGLLESISPPEILVEPKTETFLKDVKIEYLSKFPEYRGTITFYYYFIAPQDGVYNIRIPSLKVFDPSQKAFKNLSTITRSIKVHIPSSIKEKDNEDLEKKLNIKIRPDYDFYIFLSLIIFFTVAVIVSYFKTQKAMDSKKIKEEPNLSNVLRSILISLEKITKENLRIASLSEVKKAVNKTELPDELKLLIEEWLNESYETLYIKKRDDAELMKKGLDILKSINEFIEKNQKI